MRVVRWLARQVGLLPLRDRLVLGVFAGVAVVALVISGAEALGVAGR